MSILTEKKIPSIIIDPQPDTSNVLFRNELNNSFDTFSWKTLRTVLLLNIAVFIVERKFEIFSDYFVFDLWLGNFLFTTCWNKIYLKYFPVQEKYFSILN